MIVYLAVYNPCIYESEYGVISIHSTKEGAALAMQKHIDRGLAEKSKQIQKERKYASEVKIGSERWKIETREVLK